MPLTSTTTPLPQNFLVILYHGHQLLDSAGPLDILSTITKSPEGANFTLTLAAESLDPVNLVPVPPKRAAWRFEPTPEFQSSLGTAGASGQFPGSGFNPTIIPDVTFDGALKSLRETGKVEVENVNGDKELRSIDVLFIPGGIGSRMYRIDKASGARSLNVESCVDFARTICLEGFVQSAVMTVCTGSDLFARTGLLDGRRATTNHLAFQKVAERHKGVQWMERRRWVRSLPGEVKQNEDASKREKGKFEKEVWTSAGISAGMDLTLWFVAEVYGKEFARSIARRLEYEWRENVGEGEIDPFY